MLAWSLLFHRAMLAASRSRIRTTAIAIGLSFIVVSAEIALAQESQAAPTFQVADVHKSAPAANPAMQGGVLRGGRIEMRRATMLDLIKIAYGIDPDLVFGGPNWLDWDRFDVSRRRQPFHGRRSRLVHLAAFESTRSHRAVPHRRDGRPSGPMLQLWSSRHLL